MVDREKVIRAMECCAVGAECDHCPYSSMNQSGHEGCYQMHADALALLKAQEPRLVTVNDFEGADEYGWLPAWCEQQTDGAVYCECILADALKEKGIRYWTSRPTDAQREAVKWE